MKRPPAGQSAEDVRAAAKLLRSALAAHRAGRAAEAGALARKVLRTRPQDATANALLGVLALAAGEARAAIPFLRRSLRAEPGNAKSWNNLGTALRQAAEPAAALKAFQRAQALSPDLGQVSYNIGLCLKEIDRPEDALAAFERAALLAPEFRAARHQIAETLRALGRFDEALAGNEAMLRDHPDYARAHYAYGLGLLLAGRFAEGWEEYEWRLRCDGPENPGPGDPGLPLWEGEPLEGRRLLVRGEQGPGDQVMFAAMLPDAMRQSESVTLACDARLIPLLTRSWPDLRLVPRDEAASRSGDPGSEFDCQIALGSLGRFFRRVPGDFPARRSYLKPDPERVARLRARYARRAGGRRLVGLSWKSWSLDSGARRSLEPARLLNLLSQHDCLPVSLQYGPIDAELEGLRDGGRREILRDEEIDPTADLDGLAAQIAALDLVITVANTTAHLAGAVGAPTLLLLSAVTSWHWMIGRDDSPWYPSLRLIRQAARGDWESVLARVAAELED